MLILGDRSWRVRSSAPVGFLLLVSMVMTAALSVFGQYIGSFAPEGLLQAVGSTVSLVMITLLFALKWLPDTEVQWRDVWLGVSSVRAA